MAASRREAGAGVILEASHDGYVLPFGLIHRRLIMMAPSGEVIGGEDNLIGAGGDTFAARFHLHPDVQASVLGNGRSVLLKLRRSGWRFDATGYPVCLKDSVFRTKPSLLTSLSMVYRAHNTPLSTTPRRSPETTEPARR